MSKIAPHILSKIQLYNRCAMFSEIRLPYAGGLLDQPESVLQTFEVIHGMVLELRAIEHEKANQRLNQRSNVKAGRSSTRRVTG